MPPFIRKVDGDVLFAAEVNEIYSAIEVTQDQLGEEVADIQASLATKANTTHTHTTADINALGIPSSTSFLRGDGRWVDPLENASPASHTHTASEITDFNTAADARITAQKAIANGLATLDAAGKIPNSQLPSIAVTDVHVVSSQAEQLALVVEEGDVAIRTDINKTYIHNGGTAGTLADWSELSSASASVTSVNNQTGVVNLSTTHITEGTNQYYTDARVTAHPQVSANTNARHTHSNKATLDATTASYTTAEQTKLSGIESGADVTTTAKVDAAGAVMNTDVIDEDTMVSNLDTKVPTQQSVKAYVDTGLETKANSTHTHSTTDVTGLQAALDGKAASVHNHDDRYYTETEVDAKLSGMPVSGHNHDDRYYTETETNTLLSGKANSAHTHAVTDITATGTRGSATYLRGDGTWATPTNTTYSLATQLEVEDAASTTARLVSGQRLAQAVVKHAPVKQADLANYSPATHNHDDRYYTESEVDAKLQGLPVGGHTHDDRYYTETEIDTALAGKAAASHNHDGTYSPATHTHTTAQVTGLDTVLAGKASTTHTHGVADLTATGTRNTTTFLRGDNTWAAPPIPASGPTINLRVAGFALNGTTNELTAFQNLIDNASDGTIIEIDEGKTLALGGQVSWTGKRIDIIGKGNAKIKCLTKLSVPFFQITNAPGTTIRNLRFEGAESTFDGVFDTQAFALWIETSEGAHVEDVSMTQISRGLVFYASHRAKARNVSYFGLASAYVTNINFNSAVFVRGSHDVNIDDVYAQNCGSALLVGSTSLRGKASKVFGYNCYDNGVYLSSAEGWEITQPIFRSDPAYTGNIGTGVKMRGSNNILTGGYFENMGNGAIITGTGIAGSDGYEGRGSRIVGARAINPHVLGFSIESSDGVLPYRDADISHCYVEGSGWNGGTNSAAYRVLTGRGHTLSYNESINHLNGMYAFSLVGASNSYLRDITLMGNKVRVPASFAYNCAYTDRSRFIMNTMENVLNAQFGLRLVESTNCEVTGTYAIGTVGQTAHIRVNDAISTNNRIYHNTNCTVSDLGTNTIIYGNAASDPIIAHSHTVSDLTTTGTRNSTTYLRGDGSWATPTNTTYALATQAEVESATSTTARLVSGQRLAQAIAAHPPKAHNHDGVYSPATHTHDDRYFTEAEVTSLINGHTHSIHALNATGTPDATTYLRGDNTWSPVTVPTHSHTVQDISATGTKSTTTFLRGDGTWATPPSPAGAVYSVENYGPVGQADDAATWQAALNAASANGGGIVTTRQSYHRFLTALVHPNKVYIQGAGSGATTLDFSGVATDIAPPDSAFKGLLVGGGTSVQLPNMSGVHSAGTNVLNFVSTPNVAPGDWLRIYNPIDYSFSAHRAYYKDGEDVRVVSVSGTTVTISSGLYSTYPSGVYVFKITPWTGGLSGVTLKGRQDTRTAKYDWTQNILIHDVVASDTNYASIEILRANGVYISNVRSIDRSPLAGLNYGISIGNAQNVHVQECYLETSRHGLTTGGGSENGAIPNRDIHITRCYLNGTQTFGGVTGFSPHGNAEYVYLQDCTLPHGVNPGGDHFYMRRCHVWSNQDGNVVYSGELLGANIVIEDCDFHFTSNYPSGASGGLYFHWGVEATRENGIFKFNRNTVDMGPYINQNGGSAVGMHLLQNGLPSSNSLEFLDNQFYSSAAPNINLHAAIWVRSSVGNHFKSITVDGLRGNVGVYISGMSPERVALRNIDLIDAKRFAAYVTYESTTPFNICYLELDNVNSMRSWWAGIYVVGQPFLDASIHDCRVVDSSQSGTGTSVVNCNIGIINARVVRVYNNTSGVTQTPYNAYRCFYFSNNAIVHYKDNVLVGSTVEMVSASLNTFYYHSQGTGAPTIGCSTGSTYLRTDGGAGSTFYVREGATWAPM